MLILSWLKGFIGKCKQPIPDFGWNSTGAAMLCIRPNWFRCVTHNGDSVAASSRKAARIRHRYSLVFPCRNSSWSSAALAGESKYEVQEGPSCIFVGPLETATKDMLEALYHQARDSYYSGNPLILDDMFDKVELKLRWYGSKSVVKYPRCSLKRQSTYADAEADPSQIWALASVWASIFAFGVCLSAVPLFNTFSSVCQDPEQLYWASETSVESGNSVAVTNGALLTVLGSILGYPIAGAAVRALQGLWKKDLVALKGSCPRCGEEVFAFVRADKSERPSHKIECHVCEQPLIFHAKVEHSLSSSQNRWVHGRIYLVSRTKDLQPEASDSFLKDTIIS